MTSGRVVLQTLPAKPRQTWSGALCTYSGGASPSDFPIDLSIVHTFWGALSIHLERAGWHTEAVAGSPYCVCAGRRVGEVYRRQEPGGWSFWEAHLGLSYQRGFASGVPRFKGRIWS